MNTQTQFENEKNESQTTNPIAKRLARMPHVITLPDETPEPRELKRLIESRIAELNAEQLRLNMRDEDQAFEFAANKCILAILKQHLDELRQQFPEIDQPSPSTPTRPFRLTGPISPVPALSSSQISNQKKSVEITETTETCLPHQPLPSNPAETQPDPTETQVRLTETELRPTETPPPQTETNPGSIDNSSTPPTSESASASEPDTSEETFAAEFQKIPKHLRNAAADLYEHIHYRSKFAKLTSEQRDALYALSSTQNSVAQILEIIAQPSPIGMNFCTSRAGLFRFCDDYRRILQDRTTLEAKARAEQERFEAETAFQIANASDETFRQAAERQLRKRLFQTAQDPKSDYHEIRWLLKSLELLRKPQS